MSTKGRGYDRSHARVRFDFVNASDSELWAECIKECQVALERSEEMRHRESYYSLVRTWIYVNELRTRGVQLQLPL